MKGHHLRSSLPRFPGKKSKLWINHGDLSFVEERRRSLEQYLKVLLQASLSSSLTFIRSQTFSHEFLTFDLNPAPAFIQQNTPVSIEFA